jgi:hypothetical protein
MRHARTAALSLSLGMLATGCGSRPSTLDHAIPAIVKPAATVMTPEQSAHDQARERIYIATIRAMQAISLQTSPRMAALTDQQLRDLGRELCTRLNHGVTVQTLQQDFAQQGTTAEDGLGYIDAASHRYCPEHVVR